MQLRELGEYRERRGWGLAGKYVDPGVSGAKDSRTGTKSTDGRWRRLGASAVATLLECHMGGEIYSFAGSLVASCQLLLNRAP